VDPRRYELLSRISAGGMGEVFLAQSTGEHGFRKRIAVKRVLPSLAREPGFIDRFVAEAKLSVSLSHTNLVQVFDLARAGEELFLVMEFIDGADLRRLLLATEALRQRVPVGIALHVGIEALKGLAFAHERADEAGHAAGVLHCDISPANLLVSYAGEVKVADFGVAQALSLAGRRRSDGRVVGKLRYMAPETLRGEPLDTRTDLYSLAVVLCETLLSQPLFERPTEEQTRASVLAGQWPSLRSRREDVPAELEDLLRRAGHREAGQRPPSARAMLAEMAALSQSLPPVLAPDVGSWVSTLVPRLEGVRAQGMGRAVEQLLGASATPRTRTAHPPGALAELAPPLPVLTFISRVAVDGTSIWEPFVPRRRGWGWGALALVGFGALALGVWGLRPRAVHLSEAAVPPPAVSAERPPAPAPVPPIVQRAPPATVAAGPRGGGAPRPSPRTGWLNVSAQPWANVSVDGRRVGPTPLVGLALPAGRHRLRFEKEHRETLERVIQVLPNQTQLVDVDLKPAP
jgi:hypothetical protein